MGGPSGWGAVHCCSVCIFLERLFDCNFHNWLSVSVTIVVTHSDCECVLCAWWLPCFMVVFLLPAANHQRPVCPALWSEGASRTEAAEGGGKREGKGGSVWGGRGPYTFYKQKASWQGQGGQHHCCFWTGSVHLSAFFSGFDIWPGIFNFGVEICFGVQCMTVFPDLNFPSMGWKKLGKSAL